MCSAWSECMAHGAAGPTCSSQEHGASTSSPSTHFQPGDSRRGTGQHTFSTSTRHAYADPGRPPIDKEAYRHIFSTSTTSDALQDRDIGSYYPVDEVAISEAFEQSYSNRSKKVAKRLSSEGGEAVKPLPKFAAGCRGLQAEFAQSWYPYVLHRVASQQLWQTVVGGQAPAAATSDAKAPSPAKAEADSDSAGSNAAPFTASADANEECSAEEQPAPVEAVLEGGARVLVQGPPGGGKSVMLAATVERMRKSGWIVLYVPDVSDITMKSMFYTRNEETKMYDTRDSAQNILKAMSAAHGAQLAELHQQLPGGAGSLLDLCKAADTQKTSDASMCAALVRLKLELYKLPRSQRSAVVLDNYNALYWKTAFGEFKGLGSPVRPLDAQELTLAANLRVLGDTDVGHTAVIAATSTSADIPYIAFGDVDHHRYLSMTVPRFTVDELAKMLSYYRYVHAISPEQDITAKGVAAAHQLTQGSGHEVRRNLHFLLPYDPLLEDMDKIGVMYAGQPLGQA